MGKKDDQSESIYKDIENLGKEERDLFNRFRRDIGWNVIGKKNKECLATLIETSQDKCKKVLNSLPNNELIKQKLDDINTLQKEAKKFYEDREKNRENFFDTFNKLTLVQKKNKLEELIKHYEEDLKFQKYIEKLAEINPDIDKYYAITERRKSEVYRIVEEMTDWLTDAIKNIKGTKDIEGLDEQELKTISSLNSMKTDLQRHLRNYVNSPIADKDLLHSPNEILNEGTLIGKSLGTIKSPFNNQRPDNLSHLESLARLVNKLIQPLISFIKTFKGGTYRDQIISDTTGKTIDQAIDKTTKDLQKIMKKHKPPPEIIGAYKKAINEIKNDTKEPSEAKNTTTRSTP